MKKWNWNTSIGKKLKPTYVLSSGHQTFILCPTNSSPIFFSSFWEELYKTKSKVSLHSLYQETRFPKLILHYPHGIKQSNWTCAMIHYWNTCDINHLYISLNFSNEFLSLNHDLKKPVINQQRKATENNKYNSIV